MKTNVETLEANKVKLTVELEPDEFEAAIDAAFKKIANQVNIPGFRRGKAPRRLIEQAVGADAARAQALNDSIPDFYIKALNEENVDAIAAPQLDITGGETEGPVVFQAEVEVRPVPSIGGYKGLKVTVPNPQPSDEDVEAQVERLRTQYGELEVVERDSKEGDFITVDIEGTHEDKPVPGLTATDYSYEVGAKMQSLGPDFDSKVTGVKAGEKLEFTTTVPPNDEEVLFRIEVKAVNERKLPELNDEWANEVSEFDTVDELKADISKRLAEVRKAEASQAFQNGVVEAIAELVASELETMPEALVDYEMQRQLRDISYRLESQGANLSQFLAMTGQSESDFVEQLRGNATSSVQADLGLRALAEKEDLQASEDEVDAEVEALAARFGQKVSRVRRDLEHADQIPAVRADIRKAKAVEWLMDNVEIVDSEGTTIPREALRFDDHEGHDHADHEDAESEG